MKAIKKWFEIKANEMLNFISYRFIVFNFQTLIIDIASVNVNRVIYNNFLLIKFWLSHDMLSFELLKRFYQSFDS